MIRNTVFASLIALGAVNGAAQAAEDGPRLVNRGGSQEVVHGALAGTVLGGAFATVTGGGEDRVYHAAPGGHTEAGTGLVGRVVNVNGETQVVYAPAASSTTVVAGRAARPRG